MCQLDAKWARRRSLHGLPDQAASCACAGMNSGVMLFRRSPWMRSFLESVAALGRIPEPELGQVCLFWPHALWCSLRSKACHAVVQCGFSRSLAGSLPGPKFALGPILALAACPLMKAPAPGCVHPAGLILPVATSHAIMRRPWRPRRAHLISRHRVVTSGGKVASLCRFSAKEFRVLMDCNSFFGPMRAGAGAGADGAGVHVRCGAARPERDCLHPEDAVGGARKARRACEQRVLPQLLLARPAAGWGPGLQRQAGERRDTIFML